MTSHDGWKWRTRREAIAITTGGFVSGLFAQFLLVHLVAR